MCQNVSAGGVVSEDELKRLAELFAHFEGATDPLSNRCKESESEFNALLEAIYAEKVKPKYPGLDFFKFRSFARIQCRLRLSKESPPYPCV